MSVRCAIPSSDVLGETPLWCERTQSLLWLDIDGGRLQRFHPASGRRDCFEFDDRYVGTLALTRNTSVVLLGVESSLFLFDLGTGEKTLLCEVEPADRERRLNDGRCDARGRFWVGSMDNELQRPLGAFYRVDPDGSVERQFGDVIVTNTVAFSPAQDRMYFSDTRRFTTWQLDLDVQQGRIANRRVFVDHTEGRTRPDGACVDAEGFLWTAIFAGRQMVRYSPAGKVDRVIDLPVSNATCACLGGPDLKTLYITTARKFLGRARLRNEPYAGSVLAVDVDVPGLPEGRFGR